MFADGLEEFDSARWAHTVFCCTVLYSFDANIASRYLYNCSYVVFYVRSPHAHREVVTDLIEEYRAAERPDYVTWGGSTSVSGNGGGDHARTSSTTDMRIRDDIGDDL